MKKDKYLFFALIFFNFLFSQEKIDENKEDKIYFTYLKKSNYIIKDSNVYGDSLMFAIDFPYLKPRKAKFSNDSLNSEFFLPVSSFINENKTKLVGILYHSNEQIEGVYDTKKNKTTLQIKRDDFELKNLFRTHFNENYQKFKYIIIVDYNKQKIYYKYPSSSYSFNFSEMFKKIEYNDDTFLEGNYLSQTKEYIQNNKVLFNNKLNPKIGTDIIFSNQKFGLIKIVTVFETVELLTENN